MCGNVIDIILYQICYIFFAVCYLQHAIGDFLGENEKYVFCTDFSPVIANYLAVILPQFVAVAVALFDIFDDYVLYTTKQ